MHENTGPDSCDYDERVEGGNFTLEELCAQKGNKIKLVYNFGDNNKFTLEMLDVKEDQPIIEEMKYNGLDTRDKLVERSEARIQRQCR